MDIKTAHNNGLINVADLAAYCGVTRPTVYSWISGRSTPSIIQAHQIKEFTNGLVALDSWI